MQSLTIERTAQKENISFVDLENSVSERDLNSLKLGIKGKSNLIIAGSVGAGKTTVLEAVIREHLGGSTVKKNLYLPVVSEMEFNKNDSIMTMTQYNTTSSSKGDMKSIKQQLVLAHAFGVQTVFIEELRSVEDYEAALEALRNDVQVVFTMHAQSPEMARNRVFSHLGEELGSEFLSHFNLLSLCKKEQNGERNFSIHSI